ncbi:hypothetical protein CSUI_001373 [Cystoisospora suis]|uniref:Uncharacterized protein n=1 Tax=Cystoisospora suis TaxID=483139 RepID=A0A2C6KXQ0_9APIC|nr:hypothetical protein CSUI_001373 [Cystoisospora suis]
MTPSSSSSSHPRRYHGRKIFSHLSSSPPSSSSPPPRPSSSRISLSSRPCMDPPSSSSSSSSHQSRLRSLHSRAEFSSLQPHSCYCPSLPLSSILCEEQEARRQDTPTLRSLSCSSSSLSSLPSSCSYSPSSSSFCRQHTSAPAKPLSSSFSSLLPLSPSSSSHLGKVPSSSSCSISSPKKRHLILLRPSSSPPQQPISPTVEGEQTSSFHSRSSPRVKKEEAEHVQRSYSLRGEEKKEKRLGEPPPSLSSYPSILTGEDQMKFAEASLSLLLSPCSHRSSRFHCKETRGSIKTRKKRIEIEDGGKGEEKKHSLSSLLPYQESHLYSSSCLPSVSCASPSFSSFSFPLASSSFCEEEREKKTKVTMNEEDKEDNKKTCRDAEKSSSHPTVSSSRVENDLKAQMERIEREHREPSHRPLQASSCCLLPLPKDPTIDKSLLRKGLLENLQKSTLTPVSSSLFSISYHFLSSQHSSASSSSSSSLPSSPLYPVRRSSSSPVHTDEGVRSMHPGRINRHANDDRRTVHTPERRTEYLSSSSPSHPTSHLPSTSLRILSQDKETIKKRGSSEEKKMVSLTKDFHATVSYKGEKKFFYEKKDKKQDERKGGKIRHISRTPKVFFYPSSSAHLVQKSLSLSQNYSSLFSSSSTSHPYSLSSSSLLSYEGQQEKEKATRLVRKQEGTEKGSSSHPSKREERERKTVSTERDRGREEEEEEERRKKKKKEQRETPDNTDERDRHHSTHTQEKGRSSIPSSSSRPTSSLSLSTSSSPPPPLHSSSSRPTSSSSSHACSSSSSPPPQSSTSPLPNPSPPPSHSSSSSSSSLNLSSSSSSSSSLPSTAPSSPPLHSSTSSLPNPSSCSPNLSSSSSSCLSMRCACGGRVACLHHLHRKALSEIRKRQKERLEKLRKKTSLLRIQDEWHHIVRLLSEFYQERSLRHGSLPSLSSSHPLASLYKKVEEKERAYTTLLGEIERRKNLSEDLRHRRRRLHASVEKLSEKEKRKKKKGMPGGEMRSEREKVQEEEEEEQEEEEKVFLRQKEEEERECEEEKKRLAQLEERLYHARRDLEAHEASKKRMERKEKKKKKKKEGEEEEIPNRESSQEEEEKKERDESLHLLFAEEKENYFAQQANCEKRRETEVERKVRSEVRAVELEREALDIKKKLERCRAIVQSRQNEVEELEKRIEKKRERLELLSSSFFSLSSSFAEKPNANSDLKGNELQLRTSRGLVEKISSLRQRTTRDSFLSKHLSSSSPSISYSPSSSSSSASFLVGLSFPLSVHAQDQHSALVHLPLSSSSSSSLPSFTVSSSSLGRVKEENASSSLLHSRLSTTASSSSSSSFLVERESLYPLRAVPPTVSPPSSALSVLCSPDELRKKHISGGEEKEEERSLRKKEEDEGADRRGSPIPPILKEKEEETEERKKEKFSPCQKKEIAIKDIHQTRLAEREEKKEPHLSSKRRQKEKEKGETKKKTTHADQDDFFDRKRREVERTRERMCFSPSAFLSTECIDEDKEMTIQQEKEEGKKIKKKKKKKGNGKEEILGNNNNEDEGRRLAEEEEIFALELELIASELDLPVLEQLQEKSILSRFLKDPARKGQERTEEKKEKKEGERKTKGEGVDVDERTASDLVRKEETNSLSRPLDHYEDPTVEGGVRCMYTSAEGMSVYDHGGERGQGETAGVLLRGKEREDESSAQTIHPKKEEKKTRDTEREELEEEEERGVSSTNTTMPALLTSTPSLSLKKREKTMKRIEFFRCLLPSSLEENRQCEEEAEEKRKESIKISEESQRIQKEKEEETNEEVKIGAFERGERKHEVRVAKKKEKKEEERKETKETLEERDTVDITQRENEGRKKCDVPLERQRMVMRCTYTPASERQVFTVEEIKRNEEEKEEGGKEHSLESKGDSYALVEDLKTSSSFSAKREANNSIEKDTKTQKEEEEEREEDGEKEEKAQWREFLSWLFLDRNEKTSPHTKERCEEKETKEEEEERERREEESEDMKLFSAPASRRAPSSSSLLRFLSSIRDDSRHDENVSIRRYLSLGSKKDKRTSQLLSFQHSPPCSSAVLPSYLAKTDISLFSERQAERKMKENDDESQERRKKAEEDRVPFHLKEEVVVVVVEEEEKVTGRRKKEETKRPYLHFESTGEKTEESHEGLFSEERRRRRRYLQNEIKIEMLSKLIEHVEALLPSSPHTSPLSQGDGVKRRIERTLRRKRVEATLDKASCGSMSVASGKARDKKKMHLRMNSNKTTVSSLKSATSEGSLFKMDRHLSSFQERAKKRGERIPPISPLSSAVSSSSCDGGGGTSFAFSSSSKSSSCFSFSPSSLSSSPEKQMREKRNLLSLPLFQREKGKIDRNTKDRLLRPREKESASEDKEEGEKPGRTSKAGEEKEDERKKEKEKSDREAGTECVKKREEEGSKEEEEDFSREITIHWCPAETREKKEKDEENEEREKKEKTQEWTERTREEEEHEGEVGREGEEEERREVGREGEEEEVKLAGVKNTMEGGPKKSRETWRQVKRDLKFFESSQMKEEEEEKGNLSEGDVHLISKGVGEREEKERQEEDRERLFEEERYLQHIEGKSEVQDPRSSASSTLSPSSCFFSLSPSSRRAIGRPSALSSSLSPCVKSLHSHRSFSPSSSSSLRLGRNKEEENRNDVEGERPRLSERLTLSPRVLFLPSSSSSSSPLSGSTSSDLSSPSSSITLAQWRKEEKKISSSSPFSSHSSSSSFFPSSLRPSSTCSFSSSSSIPSTPSHDRSHTPVHASSSSFLPCVSTSLTSSSLPPSSLPPSFPPSSLPHSSNASGPISSSSFLPLSSSSTPSLPSSPLRSPPSRLTSSHPPLSPPPSSSSVLPPSTAGVSSSLSSPSPRHRTGAPSPSKAAELAVCIYSFTSS